MQFRTLGSTGIRISALAFGAGPVPALMTSDNDRRQRDPLRHALDAGINWIDTAATYGNGHSEAGIGRALRALGALDDVHIASSAIIGFGDVSHVDDALAYLDAGPLPPEVIHTLASSDFRTVNSSTPPS